MSFFKLFKYLPVFIALLFMIPYGGANTAEGASNVARWQQASIPAQGAENGWLLASGSDIHASPQTTSAYSRSNGMPSNLYKSADEGKSGRQSETAR